MAFEAIGGTHTAAQHNETHNDFIAVGAVAAIGDTVIQDTHRTMMHISHVICHMSYAYVDMYIAYACFWFLLHSEQKSGPYNN